MTDPTQDAFQGISDQVLISLRQIIQAIDLHSRNLVKACGLTAPQLVILREIVRNENRSVGHLAKAVSLSQATVTGILRRLENRDLIVRRRSETDRRRVLVESTPAGRRVLADAPSPLQQTFVHNFKKAESWQQTMILCALQRIVAMMDAKTLDASPFLATGPIQVESTG